MPTLTPKIRWPPRATFTDTCRRADARAVRRVLGSRLRPPPGRFQPGGGVAHASRAVARAGRALRHGLRRPGYLDDAAALQLQIDQAAQGFSRHGRPSVGRGDRAGARTRQLAGAEALGSGDGDHAVAWRSLGASPLALARRLWL